MAENEKQEKGNDGLPVEIERLVSQQEIFQDSPVIFGLSVNGGKHHKVNRVTTTEELYQAFKKRLLIELYGDCYR